MNHPALYMSTTLQLLLAALGGGSLWKAIELLIEYSGLRVDAQATFRDDLIERIGALQERVSVLEEDLKTEQRARVKAEIRNEVYRRHIESLVKEINRMREKLDMETLDIDSFLTDLPLSIEHEHRSRRDD